MFTDMRTQMTRMKMTENTSDSRIRIVKKEVMHNEVRAA